MASQGSQGSELSIRMFRGEQNPDNRLINNIVFGHFKRYKVEISAAIKKTFPFLETLRDRKYISEKMFQDCQESCRNLVPVNKVVYTVLSELEKTFKVDYLEALFSEVHMREYPELSHVWKSFEKAIQERNYGQECGGEDARVNPDDQGNSEQGIDGNSSQSLTWSQEEPSASNGAISPVHGLLETPSHTKKTPSKRKSTASDKDDILERQQIHEHRTPDPEPSVLCHQVETQEDPEDTLLINHEERTEPIYYGHQINSCSVSLVDIKKEKAFWSPGVQARTNNNQTSDVIVISSDDSAGSDDENQSARGITSILQKKSDLTKPSSVGNKCQKRAKSNDNSLQIFLMTIKNNSSEASLEPQSLFLRNDSEDDDSPVAVVSSRKPRSHPNVLDSDDSSLDITDCEDLTEISSEGLRSRTGTDKAGSGNEECSCVMCPSEGEQRGQEERTETSQASDSIATRRVTRRRKRRRRKIQKDTPYEREFLSTSLPEVETHSDCSPAHPEGKKPGKLGAAERKRGPRIPKDKNMNFQQPELPVTCGKTKGTLYQEKMKQGVDKECILTENGKWLTLRNFEIEGGRGSWKNWKLSLSCGGWTLKELMENGHLPKPPNRRIKNKVPLQQSTLNDPYPKNSNTCKVCRRWGKLYCCDTCSNSFHARCYIRRINPNSDPWKCLFCLMREAQRKFPDRQLYQEAEVLKRPMKRLDRLKCEVLLLMIFCYSKSSFFMSKPHYAQDSPGLMWLNKVKRKLSGRRYFQVKTFVWDMRLITQNHKDFYRDNKFANLGSQIEAEFEKNFKSVFAIR